MFELVIILAIVFAAILFRFHRHIAVLEARVDSLQKQLEDLPVNFATAAAAEEEEPTPEVDEPQADVLRGPWDMVTEQASEGEGGYEAPETPAEPAEETVPTPEAAKPKQSFESRFGARWPVWVGGIALALGGIFMVKYSIESGLINPTVRIVMATIFGLVLLAAGEWVRRREAPLDLPAIKNALVPGVLTAAGLVTLLGAVFATHSIYGYIGPTMAFVLLASISFFGVAVSLLHGQALAGLGLIASMITPALIDAPEPNYWALFIYLAIAWLATALAARIRGWNIVPMLANVLLFIWCGAPLLAGEEGATWPVVIAQLVAIAGYSFLWRYHKEDDLPAVEPKEGEMPVKRGSTQAWQAQFFRSKKHLAISISGAITALCVALIFFQPEFSSDGGYYAFSAIVAALSFWAAWRRYSTPALIAVGAGTVLSAVHQSLGLLETVLNDGSSGWSVVFTTDENVFYLAFAIAALGVLAIFRHARSASAYLLGWSALMAGAPLVLLTASFLSQGAYGLDWPHGLSAIALGVFYLAAAEYFSRHQSEDEWCEANIFLLVSGSYLSTVLALHAFTNSVVTTILVAVAGFAYLYAIRLRAWSVLPWMLALAGVVVLARIAWQPSLVGDLTLSKTPFFNQLLPGYGIPAILLGLGAYWVRSGPSTRIRNLLQALSSLMALMTLAVLVRHALNGGSLAGGAPSLGEQSIYTLLTVGASAVLMTLDMKSPSPVFRWGSMLVGGISLLSALVAHLVGLNPFISGELTGEYPFFNLLLLGYLLPAMAIFGLTYYARGKRPDAYVKALAVGGAILAFAWVTLSVRRFWQGPGIAEWKGFMQSEMYTYSVVWLVFGVLLLVAGSRFNAVTLRLASAALVLIAVLKVFIIDMSNLEGFLRALSFIGLGAVLIGIGLFYQRVLARRPKEAEEG